MEEHKKKGTRAQYEAFIEVYEKGGYTKASEDARGKLHNNVKRLERILGVKLFDNNNKKGAMPTADGETLYNGIKELIAKIEHLEKRICSMKTIRVAVSSLFSIEQFSSFIDDFCYKMNDVKIELLNVDCVEALKNSKADFAISLKNDLMDKGLNTIDLYEDELVILHGKTLELCPDDNFDSFHFVVSNGMCKLFSQTAGSEIMPKLKVDTLEQVYTMVRRGDFQCGLCWESAVDKERLKTDELSIGKISEISNIDPIEIISCAYSKSKLDDEQKTFILCLEQHCAKLKQPIKNIKLLK